MKPQKLKIAQINATLDVGGIETMIVQLCNQLDKQKFDVCFCALSDNMAKAREIDASVECTSLGFNESALRGKPLVWNFMKAVRRLGKYFKKEKPDIVHVHGYFSIYLLTALAVRLYCPTARVVKTIHTCGLFYASHRSIDRFRLWVERKATSLNRTVVVAISNQVEEIAKDEFSKEAKAIKKIYNGVNLFAYAGNPDSQLKSRLSGDKQALVAYVARIVDGKNHDFLIDVWHELKKRGFSTARLMFIGGSDRLEQTKQKIAALGLENEIICLGHCSNVAELLKASDFAVFPSDYEGFGIALVEKMAAGLPVICSDIPPFREIISTGKNGLIIPLTDKEGWIKAIETMTTDVVRRRSIGVAASERSKNFSVELMAKGYESIYSNGSLF